MHQRVKGRNYTWFLISLVARTCYVKKVLLKISLNSQENTCAGDFFLIKLQALSKKKLRHKCFQVKLKNNFFVPAITCFFILNIMHRKQRRMERPDTLYQGSFIHEMKWAPLKSLFWNYNNSVAKLTILCETDLVIKIC